MDTKWKNIKYSLGIRVMCVLLSLIMAAASAGMMFCVAVAAYVFGQPEVFLKNTALDGVTYADSSVFQEILDEDVMAINIIAGQKTNAAMVKEMKNRKADEIEVAVAKFNEFKAESIRDCLIKYAESTAYEIDYDQLPEYKVPDKTVGEVVKYNEKSPALFRDLQQIVNGTAKGLDFLKYEELADSLANAVSGEVYISLSDYSYEADINLKIDDMTFDPINAYCTADQSEDDVREELSKSYDDMVSYVSITEDMVESAKEFLKNKPSLHYYAVNKNTNTVVSNLADGETVDDITSYDVVFTQKDDEMQLCGDSYVMIADGKNYWKSYYNYDGIYVTGTQITLGVSPVVSSEASTDPGATDNYYQIQQFCNRILSLPTVQMTVAAMVLAVLAVALLIFGLVCCGNVNGYEGIKTSWIDKLPTDLHFVISSAIIFGLGYLMVFGCWNLIAESCNGVDYFGWIVAAVVLIALAIWAVYTELWYSFIRVCKSDKKLYKNLLVWMIAVGIFRLMRKIFRKMKAAFAKVSKVIKYSPHHFKRNIAITALIYILVNAVLVLIFEAIRPDTNAALFILLLLVVFNVLCIWYAIKFLYQLDIIIEAASEQRVPQLKTEKLHPALEALSKSLQISNAKLQSAVAKAVRDERLKTELITNVSHDLKTPLTSIINYADLLSKCDIQDEKALEYIGVLNDKSSKLKRLIEDLIEASKASTGNITLHPMPLNMGELAAQAIGENQWEFEKNDLSIVFDDTSDAPIVLADGSKTFRILENLLSNAVKYSAKGSRVYVRVYRDNGMGVFEIKNISAQPLNISPQELTERFVRGDSSRTHEGNGLGLSIAKELCSAQKGKLEILIDGDLFKARVYLPVNNVQ